MINKKTLLFSFLAIVLILVAVFYFMPKDILKKSEFDVLRNNNPKYTTIIDDIEKKTEALKDSDPVTYGDLGLAWKTLADQTLNKEHYRRALDIYKKGIELTERKNTVFLLNAGNMESYLGEYDKAREYYEEAINVSPGDMQGYQKLIELHMYKLKSDKDTIINIFERGEKKMLNPQELKKWKEFYLDSLKK